MSGFFLDFGFRGAHNAKRLILVLHKEKMMIIRHPHNYLLDDAGAISSARLNLKNVIYGFNREATVARLGLKRDYRYWDHVEIFWYWFKKFKHGDWTKEEKILCSVVEEITFKHYPDMEREEIYEEIKQTLFPFLFERGHLSVVEEKKIERFSLFLSSLLTALG